MSSSDSAPRQVHLDQVGPLAGKLITAMSAAGLPDSDRVEVLSAHVTAACQRCGSALSALDLLRLGLATQPESIGDVRLTRVLRGYCMDESCKSYYYCFSFRAHPTIAWPSVGSAVAAAPVKAQLDPAVQARLDQERAERSRRRWRVAARVTAGLLVLAALLLARQWRLGGRIPVLREPRQFTAAPQPEPKVVVTPAPAEKTAPAGTTGTVPPPVGEVAVAATTGKKKAARDPELPDPSLFKPDPVDMKKDK